MTTKNLILGSLTIYLAGLIVLFFSGSMIGIEITKDNWHYYLVVWPMVLGILELLFSLIFEKLNNTSLGRNWNNLPSLIKGFFMIFLVMTLLFGIMYVTDKLGIQI
jgi:hypothetical protein